MYRSRALIYNLTNRLWLSLAVVTVLAACSGGQPTEDQEGGSTPGVDTTPPAAVVFTNPTSSPFTHFGASATYTITGTCAIDVTRVIGPGGVTINTATNRTWSHTLTLTTAATAYSFTAVDFAGNVSPVASTTIAWQPPVQLLLAGPIPGGTPTDGGTSFSLEGSVSSSSGSQTHGPSLFVFQDGFNFSINSARP